jgi:NMD protein affecting ribosome stability and mRNA decay
MARGPSGREKGVFYEQTHREGIPDPYIPRKGLKEPTICPSCRAVYHKKRWSLDEGLLFETKKRKGVLYQKCPACRKIEDGYAMGIVNLSGDFVTEHRDEIINLLRSEERHAIEKNPLERLMKIERRGNGLHVETTTDSLALRIGRVLSRAYKGHAKFDWKHGDKSVIVEWGREK